MDLENNTFEGLSAEESELIIDAVPLVTILIAGADGDIDPEETAWSKKLTDIRGYAHPDVLQDYYMRVGEVFSDRLAAYLNEVPNTVSERNAHITKKLEGLNTIFPKMSARNAKRLHTSLTSFAKHVAKASGGFLGFGSISKAEKDLMDLPMLDIPIYVEPKDESTEA